MSNKRALEKFTVVVLFVLVQVIFSAADRDTKRLKELYDSRNSKALLIKKTPDITGSTIPTPVLLEVKLTNN
jgi:hypothetical protein